MSESVQSAMRKNLIWIIGLVACLVVGAAAGINAMRGSSEAALKNRAPRVITSGVEDKYVKKLMTPQPPPKSEEEKTLEIIETYRSVIDDPDAPLDDRVRRIYASGNLKMQLGEYEAATRDFERILLEFPEHRYVGRSYFRLYDCYEKLNDVQNKQWVCEQLLKKYPPDAPENKWARMQLGMQVPEE